MTTNEQFKEELNGVFDTYDRDLLTRFVNWYDPEAHDGDRDKEAVEAFMKGNN